MRPSTFLCVLGALTVCVPISLAGEPCLSPSPNWTGDSGQPTSEYGAALAAGGDFNGDGLADVAVGAPLFTNGEEWEGRAFVYYGALSGLPSTPGWTAESDQQWARFATALAVAGDVNGDGFDDLIVGAPQYDGPESTEGKAYLYLGSASGLAAAPAWTWEPNAIDAYAGSALAGIGDVNGDGFDDVAVATSGFIGGPVHVFHGGPAGLAAAPAVVIPPVVQPGGFALALDGAGDVNGDGFDDLIVGAPGQELGELDEGFAHLYLGSAAGLAITPSWSAQGNVVKAAFGHAVAGAGDLDGDGFDDVLIGAPGFVATTVAEGRAFVFRGGPSGLASTPWWSADGGQFAAAFGGSVSPAHDLNGDGRPDVLVGARTHDDALADEGRVFAFLSQPTGALGALPAWSARKGILAGHLGSVVAGAGDVNGDGVHDVAASGHDFEFGRQYAHVFHGGPFGASAPYGLGKPTNLALPVRLWSASPPRLGQNASLNVSDGLPFAGPVLAFVGAAPAALPFDDGTVWALPSVIVPLPALDTMGSLALSAAIPIVPTFFGADLYIQVAFQHPNATSFYGTVLTNGLHWTVGL